MKIVAYQKNRIFMKKCIFLDKKLDFLVCNNFHLIPPLLKIMINNKNISLFFKKECHLLSDKLESMHLIPSNGR